MNSTRTLVLNYSQLKFQSCNTVNLRDSLLCACKLSVLYLGCTTFLTGLIFIQLIKKLHASVITNTLLVNLDDWLTLHRSITLTDLQLDAQNSYLFTYNTFIKILYMFRALPFSSSGGLCRNCIYAVSGIISDDTRGCIYTIMT